MESDIAKLASEASTKIERIQIVYFFCSFSFETQGRGRFSFFLFLANYFGSSDSFGFSHNRFLFHCWARTENAVRSG